MSIKTLMLAAAAVVTLAAPAAAFAQDYHGYDRGGDAYGYNYRHDDGHGYRRGYEHRGDVRDYARDDYGRDDYGRGWRARWDGPARYRDHDGWRGHGWGYWDYRHGYRD